jgi:hypothetical protein
MADQQSNIEQPRPIEEFLEWTRRNQIYAVTDPEIEERSAFVPLHIIKNYFNRERIGNILSSFAYSSAQIDALGVFPSYITIFCILLAIGHGDAIEDFVGYEHLSDEYLPFDTNHQPPGFPTPKSNADLYSSFCDQQWRFCPPYFKENMDARFEAKRILPIVQRTKLAGGGNAILSEINLHNSYNYLFGQTFTVSFTDEYEMAKI